MFDESAAVPAAEDYAAFTDEAQPLGPYSCTADEAGGWTQRRSLCKGAGLLTSAYSRRSAGGCMREGIVQDGVTVTARPS